MRHSGPALLRVLAWFALAVALAGCGSGEVRRIFPPQASVQQIQVEPDGSWTLLLRLQNFSTVSMRFERVEATLTLDGIEAGVLSVTPDIGIGRFAADVVETRLVPPAAARDAIAQVQQTRGAVRYRLSGRIQTGAPDRRDTPFEFDSLLNPVPGLEGTLR